ncbi:hypothetical protein LOTGIDRAFT_229530 [Lottia gigantea]|uniref:tRNA-splicing endonuclease subunit Sen54 N-terminal domain-containing protein n=1 Tax=Lottia gigantea TaxID=225164 RepID=V3ZID4_LOTGI|nr:hypothetical protein LOTGIDRAFT_229530 [Lottia gigantea]ESO83967.1 hypothetical protein LOTGIDRAFT_229530 [Lottia gigantea]
MEEGNILSGSELLKQHSTVDHSVPVKGGHKDFDKDGSWMQTKRLSVFYDTHNDLLAEERTEKYGNLVRGKWNPQLKLVEFEKEMGKFWSNMGFVDKHRKWLYPEEALFLMEANLMEVSFNELPLSIQEAYNEFISDSFKLEEYQIYCHLRRHGYLVRRHEPLPTDYELSIKLTDHVKKSKRKRKKKVKEPKLENGQTDDCSQNKLRKTETVQNNSNNLENSSSDMEQTLEESCLNVDNCDNSEIVQTSSLGQNVKSDSKDCDVSNCSSTNTLQKSRTKNWNFSELNFPSIANCDQLVLDKPNDKFLPPNVTPQCGHFDVKNYLNQTKKSTPSSLFDTNLEFSQHEWLKSKTEIHASNWKDFKQKQSEIVKNLQEHSPASELWKGEVTPVLRPTDVTTTANILNKLQIIKLINEVDDESENSSDENLNTTKISFDVYLPNAQFKKSDPGRPNHRVCVTRSCDEPPSLITINQCYLKDKVPVHWAVIDNGDVAFYSFQHFSLPIDISKG